MVVAGSRAAIGAGLMAGMLCEALEAYPWLVITTSATTGVLIDVTTETGPQALLESALRLLTRIKEIAVGGGSRKRR